MGRPRTVLVDIDGTLAVLGGRSPYDWDRVGEDAPNVPVITVVRSLAADSRIAFVTGRDEACRSDTEHWIRLHVGIPGNLYMRASGDARPDFVVKEELFHRCISDKFDVWLVLDDRVSSVAMWRSLGLTCFQVAAEAR